MRRISRPELEEPEGWVDPDYLSPKKKKELLRLLPKGTQKETANTFIRVCIELAQRAKEFDSVTPTGKAVEQLEHVATKARGLLGALSQMSRDARSVFNTDFEALAYPPAELCDLSCSLVRDSAVWRWGAEYRWDGFFRATWDLVSDLERGARYAASNCTPSRQSQLSVRKARQFILDVAETYQRITGKVPPRSKGTWFPEFMEALGACIDYRCGAKMTWAVIRKRWPPQPIDTKK